MHIHSDSSVIGTAILLIIACDPISAETVVTNTSPSAGAAVTVTPATLSVTCSGPLDASTVNASTVRLMRSGGDGTFTDGNEVAIMPTGVSASGNTITVELSGLVLGYDDYRLTVHSLGGGGALHFDGTGQTAIMVNSPSLNPTTALTLETWFRFEVGGNWNPRMIERDLYNIGTTDTTASRLVGVGYGLGSSIYFQAETWHHAALTVDGATTEWTLYVNGNVVDTITGVALAGGSSIPLRLGRSRNDGYDLYQGTLDEIRMWNVVRSQAQIQADMNVPLSGGEPGLVGYWKLDEASGQTLNDSSNHGNHATLGNDASVASDDAERIASTAPLSGVRDSGGALLGGGNFTLDFAIIEPPVNDAFADAIALVDPTGDSSGANNGATKEAGEPRPTASTNASSVWWKFIAPGNGVLTVGTEGSDFDTVLGVYTGASVNALTKIATSDNINLSKGILQSRVTFNAVAGTTYRILVDGALGHFGNIRLNWTFTPPLANDLFAHRTPITGAGGSLNGNTFGATKEAGEPNHAGSTGGKSVWFSWTAPHSGTFTFDTDGSAFDTVLVAYSGSNVNALTPVASNNNISSSNVRSRISIVATAGGVYQIAIDGSGTAFGVYALQWSEVANDSFAARRILNGNIGSVALNNTGATKQSGEPRIAGNGGGRSLWCAWTAPSSGSFTVGVRSDTVDTLLAVYTGTAANAVTVIAMTDDFDAIDDSSQVSFKTIAGTQYQIAIDGHNGQSGDIVLDWTFVPFPPQ